MNRFLPFLLTMFCLGLAHAASIQMTMSSQFLARGEQAVLEITLSEIEPPETLRVPTVPGVTIQSRGFGGPNTTILPGRKLGYVYQFQLSSFQNGKHKIPAISLRVGSKEYTSDPLEFEVFDATQISFSELRIGTDTIPYAAFFRTTKTSPYIGEVVPVELKIYFPTGIRIEEWGIPDFDRSGITAWRFEPRPQIGLVNMLGANYQCASYPSTMAASQSGKVNIGPAKIRLISIQNVMGQFGFEQNAIPLNLQTSALDLDAKALPENPPDGFTNAVGSFELSAAIEDSEVREGDPVRVNLSVSGRGNLDSLAPPVLADPEGWKLYDANREEMGEERRLQRGTANFQQFMRPTTRQTVVPPFKLVYFDPDAASYKTLSTSPIPLKVLPSTNPGGAIESIASVPQAADLPIERMTDILGLIQGAPSLRAPYSQALPHLWHLVPLVIVLTLAFAIFQRRFAHLWHSTPEQQQRKQAWKSLEQAPADSSHFLRHAGRFIESWIPTERQKTPEVEAILQERDAQCFLPQSSNTTLPASRRQEILRTLKKLAFTLLFFIVVGAQSLQAAEAKDPAAHAYQQGKYKDAIGHWLAAGPYEELSATTLYNIGNACYRAGSQGHAALYYRRTLLVDPTLDEARQNLRFLERKFGALTIKRPEYQYTLTKFPASWFRNILLGSLWGILIAILVFPATRRGSNLRIAAISALLICPLLTVGSSLARHYYPNDAVFAPYEEQAVVIADKTTVHADASRTSGQVIEVPAGSLCRVIRRTDRWVYIAFASQTRGWVPADRIEELIPSSPPKVPDFAPAAEPEGPSA
jgi:tetratricopeptide (TPR) repeat protein